MSLISLFSLDSDRVFAEAVAQHLNQPLGAHEERDFEDGEHKIRPLESVRGHDVYLLQSLYGDARHSVNDKLVRTLFFLGALRDAGAARLTAVIPYLCYARKDRQTKPRDPLSLRYLAQLFEAVGADQVLTLDVHNPAAFQNAFRCPTIHLTAVSLFMEHFAPLLQTQDVTVASPDVGGMKRVDIFREALERRFGKALPTALMEKRRSGGVISGDLVAGDFKDRSVVILDDLIAGGTTMTRAARAFMERGAREVFAVATHGVFSAQASDTLADSALREIVITDSIPCNQLPMGIVREKLQVVSVSTLVAHAIQRLHSGGSIVELLAGG